MPRHLSPAAKWTQYLGARTATMALTAFDSATNLHTAAFLGRCLYRFDKRHRVRTRQHLQLAFPDKSPEQIDDLARRSFEHFVELVVELLHTPRDLHRDNWPDKAKVTNMGGSIDLLNTGTPAILLTGHLGNWEVLGFYLAVLGYPIDAVARPIDNPLIDRWLLGVRRRRGLGIITKWNATERMLQTLQSGGALGFIADQNAGDKGLFVPFFGRLASTYKSIGLLAIDQNVPIICGCAGRIGPGARYEMMTHDIIRPEDWKDRRDPLYYVTARFIRSIEQMIRMRPEHYLWMHRRWKSRPRHEREGKPMPAALRRNLEELPWMTPELMGSLEKPVAIK